MKGAQGYVVDASVVVKWFCGSDDDTARAAELLDQHIAGTHSLASCSLLLYEVSGALLSNRNLSRADVSKAMKNLLKLGLELVEFQEVVDEAVTLASTKAISICDAAYVAVSQVRHLPLVTANRELLQKVADIPFVTPLEGQNP
jgi:predicted nucleic acid-binding protein